MEIIGRRTKKPRPRGQQRQRYQARREVAVVVAVVVEVVIIAVWWWLLGLWESDRGLMMPAAVERCLCIPIQPRPSSRFIKGQPPAATNQPLFSLLHHTLSPSLFPLYFFDSSARNQSLFKDSVVIALSHLFNNRFSDTPISIASPTLNYQVQPTTHINQ